ncbi:MAG TPA: hypothetical protein VFU59_10485 [Candidatus Eisenbacteria bacterium]|nr:hypothetical protein [Candidatus Eisenbacteria bacterium]
MNWRRFDPKEAAREAVNAATSAVGGRLVSATLYGSAAMGTFHPDRSDLNIAFVFSALDAVLLRDLEPANRVWRKKRLVRPLLLTPESLAASRDTFPLEYTLIVAHHEALHGPDPFAGLPLDRAALRLQVERTLRTQSLALAWSYLDATRTPSGARHWATRAGTAIAASASGLLHLAGETIPASRIDLAAKTAATFDVPASSLQQVLLPPGERPPLESAALFAGASDVVHRLLDAAERLDATPERNT